MDLTFTPREEAFRAEARAWLAAHVPRTPLVSMDTAAGFEEHRAWERTLNEGRFAMVPWPVEYGGRGANLIEWLDRRKRRKRERQQFERWLDARERDEQERPRYRSRGGVR